MFYVPDGTDKCGFYECAECGNRFLDLRTEQTIECPYCEKEVDMEIGPDDDISDSMVKAGLVKVLEGEDVEKYDKLLSLAVTGGDYEWI